MINKLIKKMQDGKKHKKKQELDYLKHKVQSLESKVLMRSLERNQMEFMNSMKKGYFQKKLQIILKKELNSRLETMPDYHHIPPLLPNLFNSFL